MLVTILFTALLTSALLSQEPVKSNKSPIRLKAIRDPHTSGARDSSDARLTKGTLSTIQAFKRLQNPDGSWGCNESKGLSTPLVLTALCGHGKHLTDDEYGECVSRAQNWVLANSPTSVAERVASAVALSVATYIQYGEMNSDKSRLLTDKANQLLHNLDLQPNSIWETYLMAYRLHPEIKRPSGQASTKLRQNEWKQIEVEFRPTTLDGYLALCVATCLRFHTGGQDAWGSYYSECQENIFAWQQTDGLYPCEDPHEKYACAALATECRQVYYIFRHW